jgi:hypothetical protein
MTKTAAVIGIKYYWAVSIFVCRIIGKTQCHIKHQKKEKGS